MATATTSNPDGPYTHASREYYAPLLVVRQPFMKGMEHESRIRSRWMATYMINFEVNCFLVLRAEDL